jgi:hypothetical protein
MKGRLLAAILMLATAGLVVVGTLWPVHAARAYTGGSGGFMHSSSTAEGAVDNLAAAITQRDWHRAYDSLANKGKFTEAEFIRDLTGSYDSLRRYATVDGFEVRPLHQSDNEATEQLNLKWSTVVGIYPDKRELQVVKNGGHWQVVWPLYREPHVPPQVIAVNYLRWDVIYRGPGDDWGAQDVDAPHVRIIDMHPVDRAEGVVLLGELLNEDVVPAYVNVRATLLAKNGSVVASEGSFDKISHVLLPKQVTPFLISFHDVPLSSVSSIRMDPVSSLVAASADPVIEIQNQKLTPAPDASLTGELVDQSGQIVNVAHILGTFYDKSGQLVWVADHYTDRALLPQTPVPFNIPIPEDLARRVSSERAVVATFSANGLQ